MQYSVVALAALVAGAAAGYNGTVAYTTEIHTAYTTVCPASTQLTFNGVTYTATASTVLTITNCPCTIVKPVTTSSVVATTPGAPAPPVVTSSAAPVYVNSTTPAVPVVPVSSATPTKGSVGTTSAKTTAPTSTFTGAANKAMAASGAGLAGLIGLAAYIL